MRNYLKVLALFLALVPTLCKGDTGFKDFITARGDQLYEGNAPFRFISWNIPNLQMIEDNVPFTGPNPWRLPDQFELTDALATVRQMGGTVVRTYVLSVRRADDLPGTPRHVLGPGKFNEEAFSELDLALQIANEQGVRLIIPLVDNWTWQGGRGEYAGFRGKTKDDFWTDRQIIADFKQTIRFLLTRTNTFTGTRYCDDKAILCWETGNELSSPPAWTREIASYIKSVDSNHLVMDGFNAAQLRPESISMPEVDIVTTHHYPGSRRAKPFAELIRANWAQSKGKKPYIVGEFGFVKTDQMEEAMEAIKDTGMSGGLLWSLRFRNRDGGFYWHSEPAGGNLYKAFHWPPSPIGDPYEETRLMNLVRTNAFAIRALPCPAQPAPATPKLLPIADAAAISWQGSVGASSYSLERAPGPGGPWSVVAPRADESFVQYRPLFADETAPAGDWYYRVRASNDAGTSEPSNVVGPVKVIQSTLVDELADFSKIEAHVGNLAIRTRDCRKAKEDAHRAAGGAGDAFIYRLPSAVRSFRLFAFFPRAISDPVFSVSSDGKTYRQIAAAREAYFQGSGDYDYWRPVLYHADAVTGDVRFLKVALSGETQVGRVEIVYALKQP